MKLQMKSKEYEKKVKIVSEERELMWNCLYLTKLDGTSLDCFCFSGASLSGKAVIGTVSTFFYQKEVLFPRVWLLTEAFVWRCSVEKVFLEISQNSQENTCARASFLIKLQALGHRPATSL